MIKEILLDVQHKIKAILLQMLAITVFMRHYLLFIRTLIACQESCGPGWSRVRSYHPSFSQTGSSAAAAAVINRLQPDFKGQLHEIFSPFQTLTSSFFLALPSLFYTGEPYSDRHKGSPFNPYDKEDFYGRNPINLITKRILSPAQIQGWDLSETIRQLNCPNCVLTSILFSTFLASIELMPPLQMLKVAKKVEWKVEATSAFFSYGNLWAVMSSHQPLYGCCCCGGQDNPFASSKRSISSRLLHRRPNFLLYGKILRLSWKI